MSDEGNSDGDIERFDRSSNRIRSPGDESESGSGRPDRRTDAASNQPATGDSLAAEIARSVSGRPVSAASETVEATLVGIPEVDVSAFVYDHQVDDSTADRRQPVALFDLENTGHRPVHWQPSRTKFIGTDGYTYQSAQLTLDPSSLGPGCHTRQVEIEPGRRARVVTLVERLPQGVSVAEVVHTLTSKVGGRNTERLVFAVD